jgi:WD40 repeat protein
MPHVAFTDDGNWLATTGGGFALALWPLTNPYYRILQGHDGGVFEAVFAPDGSHLFTQGRNDGIVLSWDLSAGAGLEPTVVFQTERRVGGGLAVDPHGRFVIVSGGKKVPLDGGDPIILEGFHQYPVLDPSGRFLAGQRIADDSTPSLSVLDLETGEWWMINPPGEGGLTSYAGSFDQTGRLLVARGGVVSRWDWRTQTTEVLFQQGYTTAEPRPDGSIYMVESNGRRVIVDIEKGSKIELPESHQSGELISVSTSVIATGQLDGEIRVGPISGDSEPHLLLGHDDIVWPTISPDGKWVMSESLDDTVRLWPMPDLSKPPLHTLPHHELIAKLKTLTNLRVVRDEESSTGWKLEVGPFPGWETVPTW